MFARVANVFLAVALVSAPARAEEPAPAPASISVHPLAINLRHPRQPHSLQVLAASADGYTVDVRAQAKFTSADPAVAVVDEHGWVRPIKNGQAKLTVSALGQTREVTVNVQLAAAV